MVIYQHQTSRADYSIEFRIQDSRAYIALDDSLSLLQWRNSFDASAIEKLTVKAGRQLSYQRWLEILSVALSKSQIYCYVDVLTSQDLDKMRGKKVQESKPESLSKRYLILTLMQSESRWHFPLPLVPEQVQRSVQEIRKIYLNLQVPIAQINMSIKSKKNVEVQQYRAQNQILKQKLKRLQGKQVQVDLEVQRQSLMAAAHTMENQLNSTIQSLQRRQLEINIQLQSLRGQMTKMRAKLIADDSKASKQQADNQKELGKLKNELKKNQLEIQKFKNQTQRTKKRDKENAVRVKQLQAQLDAVRKQKMVRGNTPYSNNSSKSKSQASGSVKSKGSSLNRSPHRI